MGSKTPVRTLEGKKALVLGIANRHSIAYGCAKAFRSFGAELAITYLNDKARPFVEPLARELGASMFLPLDVQAEGQMERVFEEIGKTWGTLDFAQHSAAYAPKADLHGRVTDCSREGFLTAMEVPAIRSSALPGWRNLDEERRYAVHDELLRGGEGRSQLQHHGTRQSRAGSFGPLRGGRARPGAHRVHAISPGPLKTRAASGIAGFDELLDKAAAQAPAGSLVSIEDVGFATAALAGDNARLITGGTNHVDGGLHIIG